MRSSFTIFQFHSQVEKGKAEVGFYSKYRLYSSTKFCLGVYFGVAVVCAVIAVLLQFLLPGDNPVVAPPPLCLAKQATFIIVQVVVLLLFAFSVVIKIWNVEDAYFIKMELRLLVILCSPFAILWVVGKLSNKFTVYQQLWFVIAAIMGSFVACFAFPLVMVFLDKRRAKAEVIVKRERPASLTGSSDFEKMREVMRDPPLFELLKARCLRAWCVENLLFFQVTST